jgi:hypothetical protein
MAAHQVNITDRRKTRQNLFGFGSKPAPAPVKRRRGGLTLSEAGSAAFKAGKKSRDLSDFDLWLERKRLDDRSDGFIDRVRDDYKRGVARSEADEENKEFLKQKREQAREVARDRREQARDERRSAPRAERATSSGRARKPEAEVIEYPDEKTLQEGFRRGLSINDMLKRRNPGASVAQLKAYLKRRKNPASASAEVFEEFHGFAPSEVVTVTKEVHHHGHLASLGTLVQLDVFGVDERGHKVTGFKGAILACNETRDQLFIEGGDQRMDLKSFGIKTAHEMETLGQVTNIGYKTNKTHLGDEGGEAVYVHRFRATNQNGKHVVVKMTREPDLIYDVRNEQLLFSGGSYEILREGINK